MSEGSVFPSGVAAEMRDINHGSRCHCSSILQEIKRCRGRFVQVEFIHERASNVEAHD